MPAGRVAWGAALAAAGLLEIYGITNPGNDDTLSEFTRWAFQVDHPAGRVIFGIGWVGFAAWFLWHILSGASRSSSRALSGPEEPPPPGNTHGTP